MYYILDQLLMGNLELVQVISMGAERGRGDSKSVPVLARNTFQCSGNMRKNKL